MSSPLHSSLSSSVLIMMRLAPDGVLGRSNNYTSCNLLETTAEIIEKEGCGFHSGKGRLRQIMDLLRPLHQSANHNDIS